MAAVYSPARSSALRFVSRLIVLVNGLAGSEASAVSIVPLRPNSTGLLPQRTHRYVHRPVDLATRRRA